mgnify:CR=1 FL=1
MAKITRHNYEAFFIDYIEGNLTSSKKNEFISFLDSNPDIKEELQSWEQVRMIPDTNIQFAEKSTLKKTHSIFPGESPFEELCIAKTEGDLTESEAALFDQYIKEEPEKAKIYNHYTQIKLTPDESIVFSEKENLKAKKSKLVKLNYQHILALAASIALIVGLFLSTSTDSSINNDKYANLEYFKKDIPIFVSIKKTKNKIQLSSKNIKHINSPNNNLLPIAKIEIKNNFTSSNNSISKIKPIYFSELKTVSENDYTTKMYAKADIKMRFAERRTNINSMNHSGTKEQPNRFLLDLADLGFKSISKLTGKEIELKRSYNENGELKRLAFKTESFSISTKMNE